MAKQSEHGRLIAAAANEALTSLGCVRRGRSRIWQSDHRYWAIDIEFQPSGWSKGSYLNIHMAWLWAMTGGYPYSYRAGSFIEYESAEQFTPLIANPAAIAAAETNKVRVKFGSFPAILEHIKADDRRSAWPGYNAAIACALAGELDEARRYLDKVKSWAPRQLLWQSQPRRNALRLAALLNHPDEFRKAICSNIAEARKFMGLPPDPGCLDALESIAKQSPTSAPESAPLFPDCGRRNTR